jgi:hypothetical protein
VSVAAPAARRWTAPVGLGVVAAAGCVALAAFDLPDQGPVLCPFRALTGLDCPGCGMTRAVGQITRGRVGTAFDYNALLVFTVPVVAYLYLGWLATAFGRRLPPLQIGRRGAAVLLVAASLFTLVRNLPVGPGRYLNSDPTRS